MATDIVVKRNDWGQLIPIRVRLKALAVNKETGEAEVDESGKPKYVPIDLTNAEVVHIYMLGKGLGEEGKDLLIKTGPMTFVSKSEALLEYDFEKAEGKDPADTAVAGTYEVEFEITLKEGKGITTVPNERAQNPTLQIDPDLNEA